MPKRYVFWRGPDSKPISGPRGAPTEILRNWGLKTEVTKEGKTSWNMFNPRYDEALKMAVFIGDDGIELNSSDASRIVLEALREEAKSVGGGKPIDPGKFLTRADMLAANFFKTPRTDYVLITTLSVRNMPVEKVTVGGTEIRFLKDRSFYRLPKVLAELPGHSPYQVHIKATQYQWVAIATSGRSWAEAIDSAMHAVSLFRAIWTMAKTYGRKTIRFGSGLAIPISVIHIGPVQTLHRQDGEPVSDEFYWRDTDPRPDRDIFDPRNDWEQLQKIQDHVQNKLVSLPYRVEIEQILIRYIAALDNPDYDVASLQMWAILETITDTVGRYDETAKRAAWIWVERVLGKQVVECLRIQRNRYVHASQPSNEREEGTHLVKAVVEPLLEFLIDNGFNVSSISEFAEVLALPTDQKELRRQKSLIETGLRIHQPPLDYSI